MKITTLFGKLRCRYWAAGHYFQGVRVFGQALLTIYLLLTNLSFAMGTPTLTEEKMLEQADVVVEGQVVAVNLASRGPGKVYKQYERGDFYSWLLVSKNIKGSYKVGSTMQYFVNAYMEGSWDVPYRYFIYKNTEEAITPGTVLRVYLKYDNNKKVLYRVHFNSGFTVIKESEDEYPSEIGIKIFSDFLEN